MDVWVNFLTFYGKMYIKKLYKEVCRRRLERVGHSRTTCTSEMGVGNYWLLFGHCIRRFCFNDIYVIFFIIVCHHNTISCG